MSDNNIHFFHIPLLLLCFFLINNCIDVCIFLIISHISLQISFLLYFLMHYVVKCERFLKYANYIYTYKFVHTYIYSLIHILGVYIFYRSYYIFTLLIIFYFLFQLASKLHALYHILRGWVSYILSIFLTF